MIYNRPSPLKIFSCSVIIMECECGNPSKYKCPVCTSPYCSVKCCKIHKSKCLTEPTPSEPQSKVKQFPRNFLLEDEDDIQISLESLQQMGKIYLGQNSRLKQLLSNPEIQKILRDINNSENRLGALRSVLVMDKKWDSILTECFDLMLKTTNFLDDKGISSL